jgi:hypothetical protein
LRRMANEGLLRPTDMVWTQGMAGWSPAGSTPEVFPGALPEREPEHVPLVLLAPAASTEPESIPIEPMPLPDSAADDARPDPVLPAKKPPRDWLAESLDPAPRRPPRRSEKPAEDERPRRRQLTQHSTPLGLLIALGTAGGILSVALLIGGVVFLFGRQRVGLPLQGAPAPAGMEQPPDLHIPDIDLYIKDQNGNVVIDDHRDDPTCIIDNWSPAVTGDYEVDVVYPEVKAQHPARPLVAVRVNVAIREQNRNARVLQSYTVRLGLKETSSKKVRFQAGTRYQITVRTELVDPPAENKGQPAPEAPAGVSVLDGSLDFGQLAPGKEYVFKLQVPPHTRAEIRALGHRPAPGTNLDIIVNNERDNSMAAKENAPNTATATVILNAAASSEIYRIHVVNAGTTPARGTVFFTKTAKQ